MTVDYESACRDPEKLVQWFKEVDGAIMAKAVHWPACFGGQYRVEEGFYISEDDMLDVLPETEQHHLYLLMANDCADVSYAGSRSAYEIVGLIASGEAKQVLDDIIENGDPEYYYTDAYEYDFPDDELAEMRRDRPELFQAPEPSSLADLAAEKQLEASHDAPFISERNAVVQER